MLTNLRDRRGPAWFFTGQAGCYCCGDANYFIRKYENDSGMSVVAQVDMPGNYNGPKKIWTRGGKIVTYLPYTSTEWPELIITYDLDLVQQYSFAPAFVSPLFVGYFGGIDSNGSVVAVCHNSESKVVQYQMNGTENFTYTVPSDERPNGCAIDSNDDLWFTTVRPANGIFIPRRDYLYKVNASGVFQSKTLIPTAYSFFRCASDDYLWTYISSSATIGRRSPSGTNTTATLTLQGSAGILGFKSMADASGGMWIYAYKFGASPEGMMSHVTSALAEDENWGFSAGTGWNGAEQAPIVNNGTSELFMEFGDKVVKYNSSGTAQWTRMRSDTPNYWSTSTFLGGYGIYDAGYADDCLYLAGMRTPI